MASVTLREVDACAWDPSLSRRNIGVLRTVVSCVTLPPPALNHADVDRKGGIGGAGKKVAGVAAAAAAQPTDKHPAMAVDGGEGEKNGPPPRAAPGLRESPWFRQVDMGWSTGSPVVWVTRVA